VRETIDLGRQVVWLVRLSLVIIHRKRLGRVIILVGYQCELCKRSLGSRYQYLWADVILRQFLPLS
jgi:hypothetical protein